MCTPSLVSFLVCVIQVLLSIRDTKTHLIQIYKGNCDYVPKRKDLKRGEIAESSLHYGAYNVGYLVYGYIIIYIFLLLLGLLASLIYLFNGAIIIKDILLYILPYLIVLVIIKFISITASSFLFVHSNSNTLAIDNFRLFNVYIYFNFFFEWFFKCINTYN